MPAETASSQPSRITPERCARYVAHYGRLQGLTGRQGPEPDWTFTVEVVPGLTHPGPDGQPADAWAVVDPRPAEGGGGHAHVQVRDIDATPIPGFDGDPMREIRVAISHELWHAAVAEAAAKGWTIDAEEQLVEAAAQAVVTSEGTGDARVMARSVAAIPAALRARIAARAPLARGGTMEAELIQKMIDAIKAGDGEAALKMLEEALVKAGSGGEAPPPSEPGEAAKVEPAADGAAPGAPAAKTENGPPPMEGARTAARKGANVETTEQKRARLAQEDEAITTFRRQVGKDDLVTHVRARLAGNDGLPAIERRILSAPDFITAKLVADVAIETAGGGGGTQRARALGPDGQPIGHKDATENVNGACPFTVKDLTGQGLSEVQAKEIVEQWSIPKVGPKLAEQSLHHARARLAPTASPWMPNEHVLKNGAGKAD